MSYMRRSPYGGRLTSPSFNLYTNIWAYKTIFYLRRKIPVMGLYYFTKAIGTKKMRDKVWQLKDAIDKCEEIGQQFEHFTKNEWIFDTKNSMKILDMLNHEER
mmetsp:Transcript_12766/g.12666  ORF Transcript_12766/g.12666 Transcript_12766/m.12666 type:complete len:103 (-) Transcript_12766:2218-2526(-)